VFLRWKNFCKEIPFPDRYRNTEEDKEVARACQRFGQMQMVYEGTTIQCRALRDKDKCLVELTYLQEGKLVGKEELNGCR